MYKGEIGIAINQSPADILPTVYVNPNAEIDGLKFQYLCGHSHPTEAIDYCRTSLL